MAINKGKRKAKDKRKNLKKKEKKLNEEFGVYTTKHGVRKIRLD